MVLVHNQGRFFHPRVLFPELRSAVSTTLQSARAPTFPSRPTPRRAVSTTSCTSSNVALMDSILKCWATTRRAAQQGSAYPAQYLIASLAKRRCYSIDNRPTSCTLVAELCFTRTTSHQQSRPGTRDHASTTSHHCVLLIQQRQSASSSHTRRRG